MRNLILFSLLVLIVQACTTESKKVTGPRPHTYGELVTLFQDWRKFQLPPVVNGIPDYSPAAMKQQHDKLATWQERLHQFDTAGWPVKHQVDWHLIRAEMNGLDFDHRVIRPWEKDPAFYVWFYSSPSDVPEREGPNIAGSVELPSYAQPLSDADASVIAAQLRKAPAVFGQARKNLTGKGKDLWVLGGRSISENVEELRAFAASVKEAHPDLAAAAEEAALASDQFAGWIKEQAPSRQEASGIGIADYNWYLRNVHLVPFTWEEERALLERELMRAHAALRFAEHRNRKLPKLERAGNAVEYEKRQSEAIKEFISFMESDEMMSIRPYMEPAMREQIFPFQPSEGLRGFFYEIDYRDPMPMRAHHFHWIDKAREIQDPVESPIRRVPSLYNIFDTRAEGMATAMEEMVLEAGMLRNRPRVSELVYIMLAQRCARGLGGLYQHSGQMDFEQATRFADKWVPWGLLPHDGGTIQHEEHFYLQQPAYGECYVTGKILIDQLMAEYARQREGNFQLRPFLDEFNHAGIIPVSLLHWELTGDKSVLDRVLQSQ